MPPIREHTAHAADKARRALLCRNSLEVFQQKRVVFLIISMLAGRLVWGLVSAIVYALMGSGFTWKLFFMGGFVNAIPGIVIQLILIPVLVNRLYAAGVVKPAYEGK